ncbi:MAG TPA: flagellar hook-associated protein FlgK [Tepidisphaeraceae bacterium]|nr:flagellar hook-associated protein FlgK [Tepidisphaeraceae bacterium]
MSLLGALQVGKSALAVSQAGLQVTGNNIANAGNADYTRQVGTVVPSKDQQFRPGMFIGTGVDLTGIRRQIDEALNARLRVSVSDNEAADTNQQWLGRIEALFNELGDEDLSTQMSAFFNSWSNLANKPQDVGLRQVVLQTGQSVADRLQSLRKGLSGLKTDVGERLRALAVDADQLAGQIADLNQQIVNAEGGSSKGGANGLRDRRDALVKQLGQLVNVNTTEDKGVMNVYVGSEPLVIGTMNLGVKVKETTDEQGRPIVDVAFKNNNGTMPVTAGQIGALVNVRKQVDATIEKTDGIASNLIFELNKIHAAGQGLDGFTSVTGTNAADDPTVALNNEKSGLDFQAKNGSFVVHVKQKGSGLTTSTLVQVDLDGASGNDTTLNSLAASIDGVGGVTASVNAGKLVVTTDSPDVEVSFSQDTSGALAALGVNNFFTGSSALDISVSQTLKASPTLLAASKNGNKGDNQTALAIAALESGRLAALGGVSLKESYQGMVNGVSVAAATAKTNAEATRAVKETLETQRESLSGVSLDEEAVNLMRQQRAFQAASRLISAVDEMMRTLMSM